MRAVVLTFLIAVAVGCAGGEDVVEVGTWQLAVEGVPRGEVHAPSALDLPARATSYTLTAQVDVPQSMRGKDLTLAITYLCAKAQLFVNGVAAESLDDRTASNFGVISKRWRVHADAPSIVLELRADVAVHGRILYEPPRLSATPRGDAVFVGVRLFNDISSWIALGVLLVISMMHLALYLLDRSQSVYGWFALQAAGAMGLPMSTLALLEPVESWQIGIVHAGLAVSLNAGVAFTYRHFKLGRPPRGMIKAGFAAAVFTLVAGQFDAYVGNLAAIIVSVGFMVAAVGVIFATYVRLVRMPTPPPHARSFMFVWVLCLVVWSLESLYYGTAGGILHGVELGAAVLTVYGVMQALAISRDHTQLATDLSKRVEQVEALNVELQRQVAERSKELADALSTLATRQSPDLVTRTFDGRYRVVRKLGAGGVGVVYEVDRLRDQQRLALKTLHVQGDTDQLARFAREAQVAAEISHPNLMRVVDVGIAEGTLFLVMPLVHDGSLEQARARFGDREWARPLLAQIAAGLAALHARGIVHRDLKPANVLLDGGVAKITDFGLAAMGRARDTVLSIDPAFALTDRGGLTLEGSVFGTPKYMAPELAKGVQDVEPASDVFAYGLIAYEMLVGHAAFGEPPVATRMRGGEIIAPSCDGLDPIVARCLALDPARRPRADELVVAFAEMPSRNAS